MIANRRTRICSIQVRHISAIIRQLLPVFSAEIDMKIATIVQHGEQLFLRAIPFETLEGRNRKKNI